MVTPRPSLTNPHALRMMRDRALAAVWQRCRPHLAFLVAILLAFLVICYEKRGNWRDALATYHRWSRYRSAGAQDYARRVLNLSETL